jgi:signal transduction histidine kinase
VGTSMTRSDEMYAASAAATTARENLIAITLPMKGPGDDAIGSAPAQVPIVVGAIAVVVGVIVLCTWVLGLPGLNEVHPILGGMSSHAALCCAMLGLGLMLVAEERTRDWRWAARVFASAVVLICVLTLAASYGWRVGSEIAFQGTLGQAMLARMPVPSAMAFLALALAVLLVDVEVRGLRPTEFLCFGAALISLLALVAYVFSFVSFLEIANRRPLAFHTVLMLLALAFGILMARPRRGLMSFATDRGVVGVMVRRLLPAAIGIPVVVGWLVAEGERGGLYPPILNLSYYAVSIILVFGGLIWLTAASLHRIDVRRQEVEAEVRALNTELEAALEREHRARREAEEVSRLKDEFLMTVSHELRTPLTAICGWARMLVTGIVPSEQRAGALAAIERNAQAQTRLVNDLLDVSRVIAGKLRLQKQAVNLSEIVLAAIEALQPALEGKSLHLLKSLDNDVGRVLADPDCVRQIVTNLLSNAIKFTPAGGLVEIRVARVDNQTEIVVSDTGVGIDPEFIPFVFDRFRQGESGTLRRFGGLGLGLAIVRDLVQLHGGTIAAESAGSGKGATFRILLPDQASVSAAALRLDTVA